MPKLELEEIEHHLIDPRHLINCFGKHKSVETGYEYVVIPWHIWEIFAKKLSAMAQHMPDMVKEIYVALRG